MSPLYASLLVAIGAALGGLARYWTMLAIDRVHHQLPWGTLVVNVVGSF